MPINLLPPPAVPETVNTAGPIKLAPPPPISTQSKAIEPMDSPWANEGHTELKRSYLGAPDRNIVHGPEVINPLRDKFTNRVGLNPMIPQAAKPYIAGAGSLAIDAVGLVGDTINDPFGMATGIFGGLRPRVRKPSFSQSNITPPKFSMAEQAPLPVKPKPKIRANLDGTFSPAGETPKIELPTKSSKPTIKAQLPRDLQGAKPRYNIGRNEYHPTFESDIDKAAYITAQKTPSRRDADYLKFVMEQTGLDEAGARRLGADIRSKLKSLASQSKPGEIKIPPVWKSGATEIQLPKTESRFSMHPNEEKGIDELTALQSKIYGSEDDIPTIGNGLYKAEDTPTLYHGTKDPIDKFNTGKNQPQGYFPNRTKFTENPEYSELYSLDEYKGMKRQPNSNAGKNPNTIAAKISPKTTLDLTKPVPPEQLARLQEIFPELKGAPTKDFIFDAIKHSRNEVPFEAIRYNEHGQVNWAVTKGSNIKTPWGVELSEGKMLPQVATPTPTITAPPKAPNFLQILKEDPRELYRAPRSIMSTLDLSAPLRQGRTLSDRKAFYTSLDDMFKSAGSEKGYEAVNSSIAAHQHFGLAKKSGIDFTDLGTKLASREEQFQSRLAEAIPGFGKLVRGSSRGYTGYLNKLRMDSFGTLVDSYTKAGHDMTPELTKKLADYVNTATGRGSLGRFERAAVGMNQIFYSPRFIASRMRMLDPRTYITKNVGVRKEYLRSAVSLATSTVAIVSLATMMGAKVSDDPKSSDFGKIKVKNTRTDFSGSFQPFVTFLARMGTGKSTSGNGSTYEIRDKGQTIMNFGRSKLAPIPAALIDLAVGKDVTGNDVTIPQEVMKLYTPMIAKDLKDILEDDPTLAPWIVPAIFGAGVQTYK